MIRMKLYLSILSLGLESREKDMVLMFIFLMLEFPLEENLTAVHYIEFYMRIKGKAIHKVAITW
jgi:hypothetical protein